MQKTLSWIALVGGEIVIFVAFRLWGGGLLPEIRTLNTAVSMIVLALFFVDILIPWVDWNDRSGKRLGALGLRWVATGLYAVAAVAVMLLCNVAFQTLFSTQLLIHCILLLGLVLGFSAGGMLSGNCATHYDRGNPDAADPVERFSSRPDAAVLCYGAFATVAFPPGMMRSTFGETDRDEKLYLAPENNVTPDTSGMPS